MVSANMVLTSLTVVICLSVGLTSAFQCYVSSLTGLNGNTVFDAATPKAACTTSCYKTDTYLLDSVVSIIRGCSLISCTPANARITGVGGAVTSCCNTELCNGVGKLALSFTTVVGIALSGLFARRLVIG